MAALISALSSLVPFVSFIMCRSPTTDSPYPQLNRLRQLRRIPPVVQASRHADAREGVEDRADGGGAFTLEDAGDVLVRPCALSNRRVSNCSSSCRTWKVTAGCVMNSASAALVNDRCFATAWKTRSRRSAMIEGDGEKFIETQRQAVTLLRGALVAIFPRSTAKACQGSWPACPVRPFGAPLVDVVCRMG